MFLGIEPCLKRDNVILKIVLRPVDKLPTLCQKEVMGEGVRDGQNDGKILRQNSGPTTKLPEIIYIKIPHFAVYTDRRGLVCKIFLCSQLGRLFHFHQQINCLKLIKTNDNTNMYVNVDVTAWLKVANRGMSSLYFKEKGLRKTDRKEEKGCGTA